MVHSRPSAHCTFTDDVIVEADYCVLDSMGKGGREAAESKINKDLVLDQGY